MNNKIIFFFLLLIISCKTNKQNDIPVDLTFLEIHIPNIENGKKKFNESCITCHLYGTAGATRLGDKSSWEKILTNRDKEDIYLNVLNGFIGEKGPMPIKGACLNCSNTDLSCNTFKMKNAKFSENSAVTSSSRITRLKHDTILEAQKNNCKNGEVCGIYTSNTRYKNKNLEPNVNKCEYRRIAGVLRKTCGR